MIRIKLLKTLPIIHSPPVQMQIFRGMTSHYTDIWNIATKCCWLRETGATCNIHCQMSLSNITCRVEENSHQPYPTSPNKQKLLVRHILKRQIISLCYLGKFSVQNTWNRRDQNTSSGSFHQRMDTR